MTPEQLNEIEKLAEAATPGPWATVVDEFDADSGAHQVALHDCFSEQNAEKNAAFIAAMREHALPLIKALREARADMATIQRLAEAGLNDEAVSEICALDDIYSVTKGLPLNEEG